MEEGQVDRMDVMGHKHAGMDAACVLKRCFLQTARISAVVFLGDEARLAVVTALDGVLWNADEFKVGIAPYGTCGVAGETPA
jgi:hypothetical protein